MFPLVVTVVLGFLAFIGILVYPPIIVAFVFVAGVLMPALIIIGAITYILYMIPISLTNKMYK
jgi:hypothetical protein